MPAERGRAAGHKCNQHKTRHRHPNYAMIRAAMVGRNCHQYEWLMMQRNG
jgi:hypothetical protein